MDMVKLTFIQPNGEEQTYEVDNLGQTLMQVARFNGVPGIAADCGGACACATCHVHIDPGWIEVVGHAAGVEAEMLDLAAELSSNSRLSCQITLRSELNGLRVTILEES